MIRCCCLIALLLVSACGYDLGNPIARPGTWKPLGDNTANLRTMVADPHDLVVGRGEDPSLATEAAAPVQRVLTGKRYKLPEESASGISVSTGQASGQEGSGNGTSQQ
jgi:hypothetical protein